MPPPRLRHPAHAHELAALARKQETTLPGFVTELALIQRWLVDAEPLVFAERDRRANLPIPTKVGDLIPGSTVDIKADDGFGRKRTIKGATVGNNSGLTTFDPQTFADVHLARAGQSLRVKQRDIVEITVIHQPTEPVFGG